MNYFKVGVEKPSRKGTYRGGRLIYKADWPDALNQKESLLEQRLLRLLKK